MIKTNHQSSNSKLYQTSSKPKSNPFECNHFRVVLTSSICWFIFSQQLTDQLPPNPLYLYIFIPPQKFPMVNFPFLLPFVKIPSVFIQGRSERLFSAPIEFDVTLGVEPGSARTVIWLHVSCHFRYLGRPSFCFFG